MQVKDVMTTGLRAIAPDATLREAAQAMNWFDLGALPVQRDDGRLIGIVTDRDIAMRATARGLDPDRVTVREVMTPRVTCCFVDGDARSAARLMQRLQVRRLPVVDRHRRPIGLISLADIAHRLGDERIAGEVLERVSEPVHA